MHEHVIGGFIDSLAERGYLTEFTRNFPHLHVRRGEDNLVRFWHSESRKSVTKADRERVEWWHHGYRAALRQWRPADYGSC
jgi:hypothetical protein